VNSSAYVAEIIRAGIEAVDKGQMEAGKSLGLSGIQSMISIVLPQAIKNILPALGNEFIVLIKETAIVGVIAVNDVTKAAQNVSGITYDLLTPLIITAVMYLIVVVLLTKLLQYFERRLAQGDKR
ncbi:MAG: amino acid ABC transporter permease, partial [Clostridiales bacterium]|nr:amino acid ABC transporter permease [Clostridiales bacterium]